MKEIHITEIGNGTKCFNFNDYYIAGLSVYVTRFARRDLIHAPLQCTDFAIAR